MYTAAAVGIVLHEVPTYMWRENVCTKWCVTFRGACAALLGQVWLSPTCIVHTEPLPCPQWCQCKSLQKRLINTNSRVDWWSCCVNSKEKTASRGLEAVVLWHCVAKRTYVASLYPSLCIELTTCCPVLCFRLKLERSRSCLGQNNIPGEGSGYRWQSERYPQWYIVSVLCMCFRDCMGCVTLWRRGVLEIVSSIVHFLASAECLRALACMVDSIINMLYLWMTSCVSQKHACICS